ncbi:hypothetical protein BDP27DRAFT_1474976 [Rhodocollybia butyracea]|uniref:Uncharacterized protein n=1 Tax=Rhodocollybia butyracea TaxID=206335 RepID=A0A9P5P5N9_9AGAR|nr:hypothetical protein BDP27DRAFT_1474976 [Rhodocollybia butyracea]
MSFGNPRSEDKEKDGRTDDFVSQEIKRHAEAAALKASKIEHSVLTSWSKSVGKSVAVLSNDSASVDTGDKEDSNSDPGTFDIKYEVIIKKARVDFVLNDTTAFGVFRQKVASEMGVPLQRFPKPVPKLVDTDAQYEDMIEELKEYMKVEFTVKGQPKKKKAFSVQLINTGGDSKKKEGKKGKVASKDDNSEPALMIDIDHQELTIACQIQAAFPCLEHPKKACYVKTGNGEHYTFTAGDISIWAKDVHESKCHTSTCR